MPVDVTVDLTGSQGVQFAGPFDGKQLQQTQSIEANGRAPLCELKLAGDWQLKTRFTYDIRHVTEERAAEIRLAPTKTKPRHLEEEIKQQ